MSGKTWGRPLNKLLSAALFVALAGNAYLAWYLHSRIEPSTTQLDIDIAALRAQRATIVDREKEGTSAQALDAILALTQAMLEQKRAAALRFVDVQYRVEGRTAERIAATEIAQLANDLAEQEAAVVSAKQQLDQYAGGLIRVVVAMRVEVVELNVALLKQKQLLSAHGVALPAAKVTVAAPPAEALVQLEEEIRRKAAEIENTEAEARRYSGGLIQVSLLMRAETEKMTLSMLDQRRLVLKYQIGLPAIGSAATEGSQQIKAPGKVVNDKEALQ